MSDDYIPTQQQDLTGLKQLEKGEHSRRNPQLGQKLLNRYEIFAIKQGGYGIVFLVTDLETDHKYAVKTYKPEFTDILPSKEQFKSEVDFWINLDPHPNITKAHFAEFIEGQLFLFMEYVSGGTLRDLIHNIDITQALNLAYQICLGMEFVNQGGEVVHADLKPENILITSENIAKVTDFGLAKIFTSETGRFPHESAGTLPYMSPEQLRSEVIDVRSDIFSYGVMFYEMITGHLPYPFNTQGITSSEWRKKLKKLYDGTFYTMDDYSHTFWREMQHKDVSERLKQLVIACILPNPHNRWQSFRELRQFFETWFQDRIDYRVANDDRADLHSRALTLHRVGQINKALAIYNQALKNSPYSAELWRDAALALVDANMIPTAQEFIFRARELNPNVDVSHPKLQALI